MKKKILQLATRDLRVTFAILLTFATLLGFSLYQTNVWSSWGEPIAWALGLAIQIGIILKGLQVVQGVQTRMEKRSFEITLGLRQGYAPDAPVYSGEEVVGVIKEWLNQRLNAGLPILTGKFVYGKGMGLLYPLRNDPADQSKGQFTTDEPLFIYTGELSPWYDRDRTDTEVILTLRDLALHIGRKFNQKRMYYSFKGTQYSENVQ